MLVVEYMLLLSEPNKHTISKFRSSKNCFQRPPVTPAPVQSPPRALPVIPMDPRGSICVEFLQHFTLAFFLTRKITLNLLKISTILVLVQYLGIGYHPLGWNHVEFTCWHVLARIGDCWNNISIPSGSVQCLCHMAIKLKAITTPTKITNPTVVTSYHNHCRAYQYTNDWCGNLDKEFKGFKSSLLSPPLKSYTSQEYNHHRSSKYNKNEDCRECC